LAMSSGNFNIPVATFSEGSGERITTSYDLQDTIGQSSAIGPSMSTGYRLGGGYLYNISRQVTVSNPSITIEKHTNGVDADNPPGPFIAIGETVTWDYIIHNDGNVILTDITVIDDMGVQVSLPKTILQPGEMMTGTGTGTAVAGQYSNLATVTGIPPSGPNVTASDPSHYFGSDAIINLEKHTNGVDADTPPGPFIAIGDNVTWEYIISNDGNVILTDIEVIDDMGVLVSLPKTVLQPGEMMTGTGSGTAVSGQYSNLATVTGIPPSGPNVTATDPSHYFGSEVAGGANITGTTYEANGSILGGVTITIDGGGSVVSSANGTYQIVATTTGNYTVTASKAGFRDQIRVIEIADLDLSYTLDFKGNNGLVPDAPSISYVLACINKWIAPPGDGTELNISKVLSVINAWQFPL